MVNLKNAVQYILSEEYLNWVMESGRFCEHGSKTVHYFDDEDLMMEYSNSKDRKKILKKYIQEKIQTIIEDIEYEAPEFLYRAIYAKEMPLLNGFFGHYWSSREDTNICVELDSQQKEYLLSIRFDSAPIDWIETLKSRLDYCYGDNEKEYFFKENIVRLFNCVEI